MTASRHPPVRLIRPDWPPLTRAELHALLSGKRVTIDEEYEVAPGLKPATLYAGGGPPLEVFYPDGMWEAHFRFRGPRFYRGRWTVEPFRGGEHLCVEAPDFPKLCRFVWQGSAPDRVFMPVSISSRGVEAEDIFNPYRLGPIEPAM